MPENWKSYFCNVNDKFSSIALNLALQEHAPMPDKPWLLWVWIYLQSPSDKGLTTSQEFPIISAIEDELTKQIAEHCGGIYAGRITGDNRREVSFYGADKKNFKRAVKKPCPASVLTGSISKGARLESIFQRAVSVGGGHGLQISG